VKKIDQIYRDNLRLLAEELGTKAALATRIERSASQVSQWISASKDSKTGKPRTLSAQMARHIEQKCGKPDGWMDQPHGTEPKAKPVKGAFLKEITPDERALLDAFAHLLPSDKAKKMAEISELAREREDQRRQILAEAGLDRIRERAANEARGNAFRAQAEVTERFRQRSLLDDDSNEGGN
jgi:hypothetical protein